MNIYNFSFNQIKYTDYSKVYAKITKHWLECGGNQNQERSILVGDKSVIACFHLTFIDDDNLMIKFTEIKKIKIIP